MAAPSKRYYWLKLKEDFFRDKVMKKLRKIAGGDTYVIIYLKMMLLSITSDGCLFYDGVEQDFSSELALDLDEDEENVRVTVAFLIRSGKLMQKSDTEFYMPDAYNAIGSEAKSTERSRRSRMRKKDVEQEVLQCNIIATLCNTEIDREKEIELEIEQDKEKDNLSFYLARSENSSTFQQVFNKPMLKEVEAYAEAENIQTDVQRFYSYYEERSWKDKNGRDVASHWKATLKRWGEQEGKYPEKNPDDYHAENASAYASLIFNLPGE